MAWEKLEMSGEITKIDMDKREVTIQGPEGNELMVTAKSDVDLEGLAVGDMVSGEYYQAVAVELRKPTASEISQPLAVLDRRQRSVGNGNGTAFQAEEISALVDVVSIDSEKQMLTIRGPEGREFAVKVTDPANLQDIKAGQRAVVNYTQATALSLEKQ
jgi:Cu/Ag efflux protein CusF